MRALLGPCSEATLIIHRIGINVETNPLSISGIAGMPMDQARCSAKIYIQSKSKYLSIPVQAHGLKRIGITTPSTKFTGEIHALQKLSLADHHFVHPGGIDLVIGANIYSDIVLPGVKKSG